jgi:hypothetical protein
LSAGGAKGERRDAVAAAATNVGAVAIGRERSAFRATLRPFDDAESWRGRAKPVAASMVRAAINVAEMVCAVMNCQSLSACANANGTHPRNSQ